MRIIILLLSFALTMSVFGNTEAKKAEKVEKKGEHKVTPVHKANKVEHKAEHKAHGTHKIEQKKINFVKKAEINIRHNENIKEERILPFVDTKYNSTIIRGGQIFSKLKVSQSHMNIKDKAKKDYVFDIHAAKNVGCTKCHVSKPNYEGKPTNYLNRISILLDKGSIDSYLGLKHQNEKDFEVKSCESCHKDQMKLHSKWLPAAKDHFKKISCETCHITRRDMFTAQSFNYGLVDVNNDPFISYIGKNDKGEIIGFDPYLVWYKGKTDKNVKLKPGKMVSFVVWVDSTKGEKAFLDNKLLKTAFYSGKTLKPEVLKAFDTNKDLKLSVKEAQIDSEAKKKVLISLLKQVGIKAPKLKVISIPLTLEHNVMAKEKAIKTCESCHNKKDNSILYKEAAILNYKVATDDIDVIMPGTSETKFSKLVDGKIVLNKDTIPRDHFMMITDTSNTAFDMMFIYLLIATLLALLGHGLLRVMFASKRNGGK